MTERERRLSARMQSGKDSQIGAAHTACFDLNQGFIGLRLRCIDRDGLDAMRADSGQPVYMFQRGREVSMRSGVNASVAAARELG